MLAGRPRGGDSVNIVVEKLEDSLPVSERGRDHEVVGRPSLDQQPRGLQVPANPPERSIPERQVDRLEIGGGVALLRARAGAVQRVDVGPQVKEQDDDVACRRGHRAVERRAPGSVAAFEKLRLSVEDLPDSLHVTDVGREVDRVVDGRVGRLRPAKSVASLLEDPGDLLVPTVAGHGDRIVAAHAYRRRVRTRLE